jgi:integrase
MRRGEAIGLRWSDVDLENGRLSVRRALVPTNREVVVSEPKTVKGRRVIALDPGTVEVLKGQAARQLEEQNEWDELWIESGLVFTAENGAALDPESVSRYWRQAVKKTLLPTIRLHDLRHTHATLALQAGIHPKVVSERLGHATIAITLDTYSHAIPAMQEEAAALIAGLVFAGEQEQL